MSALEQAATSPYLSSAQEVALLGLSGDEYRGPAEAGLSHPALARKTFCALARRGYAIVRDDTGAATLTPAGERMRDRVQAWLDMPGAVRPTAD